MQRYLNKRNDRIAVLDSYDEKTKTSMLVYEDNGKSITQSSTTMRRWWSLLPEEEQVVAEEVQPSEDKIKEAPVELTPVEAPVVTEVPKNVVRQSAASKIDNSDCRAKYFDTFLRKAEQAGVETKTYPKLKFFVLLKQGKKRMEIRFQRSGYVLNAKEEMIPNTQDFRVINNYYLPAEVRGEYTNSINNRMDNFIKWFLES